MTATEFIQQYPTPRALRLAMEGEVSVIPENLQQLPWGHVTIGDLLCSVYFVPRDIGIIWETIRHAARQSA